MSSSNTTSPDTFSNDPSYSIGTFEASNPNKRRRSPNSNESRRSPSAPEPAGNGAAHAAAKRIACVICRRRKLKCDGNKPSCSTCKRLGHDCAYDEVRRKSGPKRGYVKALEERLKQVEEMLKSQGPNHKAPEIPHRPSFPHMAGHSSSSGMLGTPNAEFVVSRADIAVVNDRDHERWHFPGDSPQPVMDEMAFDPSLDMTVDPTFTWEMIGLGLDEPLPPQDTIDELHQIYFEKIHPSAPMVHKYRYLAAMNLAPNQRPPVCLRYAMWTLASSVTDKYMDLKDHFYQRARKYVEQDYLKGHGEQLISVAHAQTHAMLSSYESKMMYFPRAWMSTGSAVRLCQMMGLHRLDGVGLDVKQCLPPARDWTEREERRRTFWMAFCEDRYASIGTGWPMSFDERDILTNLPASEEAYEKSKPETTQTLAEAFRQGGAEGLSAFGGIALMAALFGRNLVHLHRPDPGDNDSDINGEFWKRHRNLDQILLNTSLSMPSHLKLPTGLSNPNVVFANMNIHTSTICLHQASIYKAEKNRLPLHVGAESKARCFSAAKEIANIMRLISHMDLSAANPFISFCLYVAARVFVQYLRAQSDDETICDSLQFLLSAMNAMKQKNPLTESFLVQLDLDIESLAMKDLKFKSFKFGFSNNPQAQIFASHQTGPSGRIDQCNFMKIVDSSSPPVVSLDSESPASGVSHLQNAPNMPTTTQQPEAFQSYTDTLWAARANNGFHDGRGAGLVVFPDSSGSNVANSGIGSSSTYGMQRYAPTVPEIDLEMSSADANDHRTPSSTAPSDGRSGSGAGGGLAPHKASVGSKHAMSERSSYSTSPAPIPQNGASTLQQQQQMVDRQAATLEQHVSTTFYTASGTGEYMNSAQGFSMGQRQTHTHQQAGFQEQAVNGWAQEGLTPIGEGVFRELMGIGGGSGGFGGVWDGQS